MKVITSHPGSDFDSLASMVAAQRIYPDAVLSFSGAASRTVRDFLKKNAARWTVLSPRKIPFDQVTMLIVVDARSRSRIGPFSSLLGRRGIRVHVYDHHPPTGDDILGEKVIIEPVGATTTLMTELLSELGVSVTPAEASLYAMGIYEDTGGLTFSGTTSRDFAAIARMKDLGADLSSIPSAIELDLAAPERGILDALVENARVRFINGAKAVLSTASAPHYVDGLSLFVHRLRDYFEADVAFAAVQMDSRTYLIGRSDDDVLDVASFLAAFGGGGHPQAASATLRDAKLNPLIREVETRLQSAIPVSLTAWDIMTSPVMTVPPDVSVDDAYRIMLRYGHSALPVTKGPSILGLITRKDLDKAHLHGFDRTPVREFMSEGVITIRKEASLREGHRLLVTHGIGRLPVTEGRRITGIITRTDLVKALYPAKRPREERDIPILPPWTEDLSDLMESRLDSPTAELLRSLGERAESLGMKAYIVGGIVRDLLLGQPSVDLDVVVEGDAVQFVKSWEGDGVRTSVHESFKTGTLTFPGNRKVDVATARREFYEFPVAQPQVFSDSLKHDLYRRDFTVNAMAVSINGSSWGMLVDFFTGRADLEKKILRTLHNLSFVVDPTRVLRGIRIEQRLGFAFDDNTLRLLSICIRTGLLARLSGFRLKSELIVTFDEHRPYPAIRRMEQLGVWEALFPGIRIGTGTRRTIRRLGAFLLRMGADLPDFKGNQWLAFMTALLADSPGPVAAIALDRLNLTETERRIVLNSLDGLHTVEHELGGRAAPANTEIVRVLENTSPVSCLFWSATTEQWRVRRRILLYLTRLVTVQPILRGADILAMGYRQSPRIGIILDKLRSLRLDGILATEADERAYVQENFPL